MTLHDCIVDYLRSLRYEQGAAAIKAYQARLIITRTGSKDSGYADASLTDGFNVVVLRTAISFERQSPHKKVCPADRCFC